MVPLNLKDARQLIRPKHLVEAARLVAEHDGDGFEWLYERTGRRRPESRYILFDGVRYPTKAFGFLVAQIAGRTDSRADDMNVNQAAAPLKRLGGVEVRLDTAERAPGEEEARSASYYRALARPEQTRFRAALLLAYDRCAISGVDVPWAVEAAHVEPFANKGLNTLANGILLRRDLHGLFDAGALAIDPSTMRATFAKRCRPHYAELEGHRIAIPAGGPVPSLFKRRWTDFDANR